MPGLHLVVLTFLLVDVFAKNDRLIENPVAMKTTVLAVAVDDLARRFIQALEQAKNVLTIAVTRFAAVHVEMKASDYRDVRFASLLTFPCVPHQRDSKELVVPWLEYRLHVLGGEVGKFYDTRPGCLAKYKRTVFAIDVLIEFVE
ncbi:hypothetical protein N9248_02345 [bacterium]|nr:hypothetical protein [bacterium]